MHGLPIMDTVRTIVYMIIKFDPRRKRKRYRYLLSRRNILDTLKYQVFGIDIIYSYIIKYMIAYTFSQSNLKVPKNISEYLCCIYLYASEQCFGSDLEVHCEIIEYICS